MTTEQKNIVDKGKELFDEIYNKVREFSNNHRGMAPTRLKLSPEHLFNLQESKFWRYYVNEMQYLDPEKPNLICNLLEVIDPKIKQIEVF